MGLGEEKEQEEGKTMGVELSTYSKEVVHIPKCFHWLLAYANIKDSYVVIYNPVKLKHDKY